MHHSGFTFLMWRKSINEIMDGCDWPGGDNKKILPVKIRDSVHAMQLVLIFTEMFGFSVNFLKDISTETLFCFELYKES